MGQGVLAGLRRILGRWQFWMLLCAIAAMLFASLAGFEYGYERGLGLQGVLLRELDDLRERRVQSEQSLAELSQLLAHSQHGARIDREAAEQVRAQVVETENSMALLREELVFYRGLMSPTDSQQGLGIRSFRLYPGQNSRHVRFEVVVQQLAVNHSLLKGVMELSVTGHQGQEATTLSLQELSAASDDNDLVFRFKYFERIHGELYLPEDFVPEGVDLSVRTWGRPVQKQQRSFPWQLDAL